MKKINEANTQNPFPGRLLSGWRVSERSRRAACSGAQSALVENWMRKRASVRRVRTTGRPCLSAAEFMELTWLPGHETCSKLFWRLEVSRERLLLGSSFCLGETHGSRLTQDCETVNTQTNYNPGQFVVCFSNPWPNDNIVENFIPNTGSRPVILTLIGVDNLLTFFCNLPCLLSLEISRKR